MVTDDEVGFGPDFIWYHPRPRPSAMMLQGGFGDFLVSTFVERTGWLIRCNRVWPGAKNNELFLPGENLLQKFKNQSCPSIPFHKDS
jgi:hypothetical protein